MIILDVRSPREFAAGHVPGARNVPFWGVLRRGAGLSPFTGTPIVVYCHLGPRAWIAKGLLRARGFRDVRVLAGHMRRWKQERKPLE